MYGIIQRKRGVIMQSKFNMTQRENIFLAKRNIVDYIWKSANLEGIGVTYPDTQTIYDGIAVSGYTIDEINAINDLKHAWQYILGNIDTELNLDFIKHTHMLLGKFTVINAGAIRRDEVRIGGTNWIPDLPEENNVREKISAVMNKQDVSEIERALDMTLLLMRLQLFYDGNKRLAMLIGNKIMIQNGQGIITVKQEDNQAFYKLLVAYYETGKPDEIKQFLYDNCIDGMVFNK